MRVPDPFHLRKKWSSIPETQKKVFKNVMWALAGKVVGMLSGLLVGVLVGRYLGPRQYGLMNYVISYVVIFEIVSRFGLTHITIRELARHPAETNVLLGTCLALRMFFAVLAYGAMVVTLVLRHEDPRAVRMILVYGLCLFVYPFEIIMDYFTSIVQNEYIVKSQILRTIVGAALKLLLLLFKAPLEWFIAAATFDYFFLTGGYIRSYQRHAGRLRDWAVDLKRSPFLLKESFPLLLSGAAVIIYQRIDLLMIKNMLEESAAGYFATAGMFLSVVLFLPTVLVQSISPLLVRVRQKDVQRYEVLAKRMVGGVTWLSILMCACITITAKHLVFWTYGKTYLASVPALQILIWKTVGMALASSGGQILIIEGLQRWAAIRNGLACLVCIVANWIMIPRFGIVGSAWSTVLAVVGSVYVGNYIVPSYRHVFRLQVRGVFMGWLDLIEYGVEMRNKRMQRRS